MAINTGFDVLLAISIVLLLAGKAHAFGAGNIASISKIEGQNWRHGDIEDTLLTLLISRAAGGKKFSKMDVKRVYFGNWLRDYSQAVDVGTVKYVSAEAIRIVLWVLGFMTFGYGSGEFYVSSQRLGCYRPEDHIDNPKNYADNLDARDYDTRLRGPVNERVELAVDQRSGMKNYIANESAGCMTSAEHVRRLFGESIRLGRSYARSKNQDELYEALRLLGTGLHCLEDYSAHSNYVELALIELGERDVFPHVGRRTALQLQGIQHRVYPLITGTFGGVDFLHSMMGEFTDKATQSEISQLEGTMENDQRSDDSVLKDLLGKIPSGLFGDKDEARKADEIKANATAAQMNQMRVSPREPEAFTRQMQQVSKDIYPIIEWHDELMKDITNAIEKIPILPDLLEQFEEQLNRYVFTLIAPFVLPIINQIKNELNTGSSEVIQSSKDQQLIVFDDDECTDPTHSMLSKDHFSNILNEPAGKIASAVLKWVVPQLIASWDDPNVDVDRTLSRIISGVFHHPAQRQAGSDGVSDGRQIMFRVVEQWWSSQDRREQDDLRRKLSRDGVYRGENHKEGVHDTGHGCAKPLGMTKNTPIITSGLGGNSGGLASMGANMLGVGLQGALGGGGSGGGSEGYGGGGSGYGAKKKDDDIGKNVLGGLVGALGGGLLSSLTGKKDEDRDDDDDRKTSTYQNQGYTQDGGYRRETTQYQNTGDGYQQTQYQETSYPSGARVQESRRFEQSESGGYGTESRVEETQRHEGGGFDRREERREFGGGRGDGQGQSQQGYGQSQGFGQREESSGYGSGSYGHQREEYGGRHEESGGYGSQRREYGGGEERGGYGQQREEHGGREERGGYGQQREEYGREERGGYGQQREEDGEQRSYGGGESYGRRDDDTRRERRREYED